MDNLKISEILQFLDGKYSGKYEFVGDRSEFITGFSSLINYKKQTIVWIKNKDKYAEKESKIRNIKLCVLNRMDFDITEDKIRNIIYTDNPKLVFFEILNAFYGEKTEYSLGKNNVISLTAKISERVSIGNNCTIGDGVEIGEGTIIYNNVDLRRNVIIGKNCIIESCTVIGGDGFGYSKDDEGRHVLVRHLGGVKIGDDVHIGANVCIDRGTIDDTVIENGVKIDNLYQVGHNVIIGENTIITGCVGIGGSTQIGRNCFISGFAIKNQLIVGDGSFIARGSVVLRNVKEKTLVFGYPAKSYGEYEVDSSYDLVMK